MKPGDVYRELVGTIMAALDPSSTVKTEQWTTGPDGERDMDVEVRGTLNGAPHFVLVECKDHTRPIGIGFIDAFESKIRDLKAERAIIFSNSGFTRDALRKGNRVGIEMASAMKAKDNAINFEIHHEVVARRLTLTFGTMFLFPFEGHPHVIEEKWKVEDLLLDGMPVIHWVAEKMKHVASEHDQSNQILWFCTFRNEPRWSYQGQALLVGGLKFQFACKKDWMAQTVKMDASLGYYDHSKKRIVIPNLERYALGLIDGNAWEEADPQFQSEDTEPNGFVLNITLMRSSLPNAPGVRPDVDELISEQRIEAD